MKRFTTIVALVLMVAMPMMAERVSPETAQKVATTFLNNNGAKAAQLTDLSKAAGFPNLYIFTTENSFVVMAADDCAQPILGYSLSDKFIVDDMPENLRWWLQQYSDEIQWGIENGIQSDKRTADEWRDLQAGKSSKDTPDVIVGPLITTIWGQDAPYNNLCPYNESAGKRAVTGCVATAMAQVMKYWNYPEQGVGSNTYTPANHPEYGEQSANFGETTYDWANMTYTYGSSSTQLQKDAVATLMYHCGVSVNMDYDYSQANTNHVGSGAQTAIVPESLVTYFKYAPSATYKYKDDFTNDQWIALLQHELDESRPVLYAGRYVTSTGGGGHAFVCDGYRSDGKFHFNWGWRGSDGNGTDNGYWAIGALNPQSDGIGSGHGTYNLNNGAAFWVEPISSLEAPTVSVTASGSSLVLSWDAVAGADAYDIYRDNVKIETGFTQNSYTDTDIASGSYYEYYVRAVNGETRSNPSNIVIGMAVFRDIAPSNLTAAMDGENITLSWTGCEENPSVELHYAVSSNGQAWAADETTPGTYWGQRYPSSMLANLVGMEISKVSCCFYFASNYTMYVFNGDPTETDKLCERNYTKTTNNSLEWYDFTFNTPLQFDSSKDLWIVFYNNDVLYPALIGEYNGMGASDAKYIATTLEDLPTNTIKEDYSFLIRACFSEGTHIYNLYDNGVSVANDIATTSFTHENPADNTTHRYTVKTHWYGGESAASNMAGIAMGTTVLESLSIGNNVQMTVAPNSALTVTGALINDNPEKLIIENGAQLFHSGGDVYATVKKDIVAYTTEKNGWNFIASPIATQLKTATIEGLIPENEETTFDLYKYNEPNHKWYNYKPETDNAEPGFAIDPKTGYLYASSENTTLSFAGKLHSASSVSSNTLSYSADVLKGFNLVGNPLPFNAYVSKSYYKMNGTNIEAVTSNSETVAPCTGIIVEASGENESVVFSQTPMRWSNRGQLQIAVAENKLDRDGSSTSVAQVDNAIISLNEADPLQKFVFNEDNAKLYIPNGDKEYAIVSTEAKGEMPLNFKPSQDGTFTLTVQPESVKMGYLFLIDNMTGTHINLLTTPNYTFEAKTGDYESRFKLLFAAANEETETFDNESFGFIINGQFQSIIGQGLLQVIDLNGRILRSSNETDCIGLDGLTAGVYVIRFITSNSVRTQKIVVE